MLNIYVLSGGSLRLREECSLSDEIKISFSRFGNC